MANRKYYDALIASLDGDQQMRAALARWQAETATSPDDSEVWEIAGPSFLAARIVVAEIARFARTVGSAVDKITAEVRSLDQAAPRLASEIVFSDANASLLAAEVARALQIVDGALIERAVRRIVDASTPTNSPPKRALRLAKYAAGFLVGLACGFAGALVPWHAIISRIHFVAGIQH